MPPTVHHARVEPAPGRAPRLAVHFAVFTALGLAAAAAAILIVVRRADTAQAESEAIGRARLAAEAALDSALRTADLASPATPARRRELNRLFRSRVLHGGINGATLFGRAGHRIYGTPDAAPSDSDASAVDAALRGTIVSGVRDTPAGRELRTYVPLALGPGPVDGVVALDQSYGPIAAAARRTSWIVAGILEGLLLLLCLVFVPPLVRASTRLRRHVAELDRLATHDELTGLPNRLGFRRAVEAALADAHRSGAMVRVDLDGFSAIDDLVGSDHSDVLLSDVAGRLARDLVACDAVGRIGDDEFAFFVRRGDRLDVEVVADAVRKSLDEPFDVAGSPMHVTATIGAALLPEHGSDVATVLRHAGSALAVAKEQARGVVEMFDEHHAAGEVSRLTLTTELRAALANDELCLHYQPLVDVATRTVRGAEALLRWQHPRHGLLPAEAFVAQAERSGINGELRAFVLETAGRDWQVWASLGLELELSLNLGGVDLLDAMLPTEIEAMLDRYLIEPWSLVLEVTERALDADLPRLARTLDRLHMLGVRLAIDDFGSGYSSLASLRHHPVQQVKLDRSLIAGAADDPAGQAIVRGAVEMAHAIGATVVAEGVETVLEWDFVVASGCDVAQGYLTGPAVPGDELTALVQADPAVTSFAA